MNWHLYIDGLLVMLGFGVIGWLYSVMRNNVTIVDSMWSLFFLIGLLLYTEPSTSGFSLDTREGLLLLMVALWSLRLSGYLAWRNRHPHEDRRYQAIRNNNQPFWIKSLYIVFGLQAVLAWIISLPLFGAVQGSAPFNILDLFGVSLWTIGFLWESIADYQLARFKSDPANAGAVMDKGLWSLSRHPNYFGECCLWWGYYLMACAAGAWWTLPAPLLMTFLLLKVSGVVMLEKDIRQRRPAYAEYVRHTNAFIPGGKK
jgi:steroid 5-alpha reductase family enzyme